MFGRFFNFFNHDKGFEQQNKSKMQSKSAMSEDYKRAKARKNRKRK